VVKEGKVQAVKDLKDKIEESQILILTEYRGLSVSELNELRKILRGGSAEFKVIKNTVIQRAVADLELPELKELLAGPTGIAFGFKDVVAAAKIVVDFSKAHEHLKIKGAVLEKRFSKETEIKALAELPSREVLIAQVVLGIAAPLRGLQTVLSGPMRSLVYALEAVRKTRG